MDLKTFHKLIGRFESLWTALLIALAAIIGTTTNFFHVLGAIEEWKWYHYLVAAVLLGIATGGVWRIFRRPPSRLLDPDALRLDPSSPDQLTGRADDLQKLLKALVNPLVFLISESGCGKTALLRAGVEQHPDFIERYLPIYMDMSALDWEEGPLRELRERFAHALPADDALRVALKAHSGAREYISAFENYYTRTMRRPLLLLDQFDDYQAESRNRDRFFSQQTSQWRKADEVVKNNAFWRLLRACIQAKVLHVIVAVRDEASPGLDCIRFFQDTPQFGLLRLPSGLAGQIIDRLTRQAEGQSPVIADPEDGWTDLRERLVFDLQGPILPQQLKIVLSGLRTLPALTRKSYVRAGRIAGLEAAFVRDAVQRAAKACGLRDAEVLRIIGALVDRARNPVDRLPPQSVTDLASGLPTKDIYAVKNALTALAQDKITRQATLTADARSLWQLDHGYLARPILRLEREGDRWRLLLAERARLHADSDWRHWWSTLLSVNEQVWLLSGRVRGTFRYGEYQPFALKSVFRFAPVALLIAGVLALMNQSYIADEWRYLTVTWPYERSKIRPLSKAQEQALKPGSSFKECVEDCPEMVVLPARSFIMGEQPGAQPQHTVTIANRFAVSKYEVTFADWDACIDGGGCNGYKPPAKGWRGGQQPVINVNWYDAQAYVAWLSAVTDKTYRLLTEAEYEYATRAGTMTAYPWGEEIGKNNANCTDCGSKWHLRPAPVGSFAPNGFGLYDMVGNVWAWTEDCVHVNYNGAPADGSAWLEANNGDCRYRILRGGSWGIGPDSIRSASRGTNPADSRSTGIGFRIGRTLIAP